MNVEVCFKAHEGSTAASPLSGHIKQFTGIKSYELKPGWLILYEQTPPLKDRSRTAIRTTVAFPTEQVLSFHVEEEVGV
jgi:hypothetical protein